MSSKPASSPPSNILSNFPSITRPSSNVPSSYSTSSMQTHLHTAPKPTTSNHRPGGNAIDDLLFDMDDVTSDLNMFASRQPSTTASSVQSSVSASKPIQPSSFGSSMSGNCNPILLYGVQPVSSLIKPCSHLRCTQCDHEVLCLPMSKWNNSTVDYFFFRNNVPNVQKLQQGVVYDPNSSAYCCQCAWHSASGVENVTAAQINGKDQYNQQNEATIKQLRWMCSKR